MLTALWLAALLQSATFPALTGRVVDEAGVLSPSEVSALERRLERLERESSVQIVIVSVRTLGGMPIEDYGIELARRWGIGAAGLDNGVVVLFVPSESRVRIEVGYGLEPAIPDGMAGRIIRERIAPAFRDDRYFDGLSAALDGLELAARREYPDAPPQSEPEAPPADVVGSLFIAYFVLGVLGNAVGILVAMILGAFVFAFLGGGLAVALGVWAYPVGALLALLAVALVRHGGRRGSWTSGGGYSGGWGGGGGGGGFSGGGGSFGGGGASGRW